MVTNFREQLIAKLDELNEEQIEALYDQIELLIAAEKKAREYDESKDTMLHHSIFEGPPDLGERSSEILHGRIDRSKYPEELPEDYDPDNDPTIGFISGPTDLASRAKEILHDEITRLSGWTQKTDTP
jgi:hypothetical protein